MTNGRSLVGGIAGAFLFIFAGTAQVPQRPGPSQEASGTGLIVGSVVDAETGRGIGNALVILAPPASAAAAVGELTEPRWPAVPFGAVAGSRRILTAADGRFIFRDLPRGRFTVTATAPAYVLGSLGQLRPYGPGSSLDLEDGQAVGNSVVKLWRLGSIGGTVRDGFGEPAVGVTVECFRRVIAGGQKRLSSSVTPLPTDDRGFYRASGVPLGDYVCGVAQSSTTIPLSVAAWDAASEERPGSAAEPESRRLSNSGGQSFPSGMRIGDVVFTSGASTFRGAAPPPPDASGRMMVYAPQYYPASPTSAQATVITVGPGQERTGIDIQMKLVPALRVSGTLIGPDGPASFLGLRLVPASGSDMASEGQAEFARATSEPTGAFTFLGVPAGEYILKCRLYPRPAPGSNLAAAFEEPALWVATPITLVDKDITNLSITLRPGIRVSGRVEFTGSRTPPTAAEIQRVGVRMQGAEGRVSSPIPLDGRVAADASFKTAGYAGGRYIASVLPNTVPSGWSLKSITLNGRDISVEPIDLADADVTGVVVTFTDKTTSVSGSVTGPKGPDATAEVVVFPADTMVWKEVGVVARRLRVERVSASGTFAITGLPAGEYFVAAVPGTMPGDRQDPALLASLVREATRVTLADGGSATIRLAVKR